MQTTFRPATRTVTELRQDIRHLETGEIPAYEAAINRARSAAQPVHPDDPLWAAYQEVLAVRLGELCFRNGSLEALDDAIECANNAMQRSPRSLQPTCRNTYGRLLGHRGHRTDNINEIKKGIAFVQSAINATHKNSPDWASYHNSLGKLYEALSKYEEAVTHCKTATEMGRHALRVTPRESAHWVQYATNLASHLDREAIRTCQPGLQQEALELIREAIAATPATHAVQVQRLNLASRILRDGCTLNCPESTLDDALDYSRRAVEGTPKDHYDYHHYLSRMALILFDRYKDNDQLADLDEGIELLRIAAQIAPKDSIRRCDHMKHLSAQLCARFEAKGDLGSLDEAISVARETVATSFGGLSTVNMLRKNLAWNLNIKYRLTRDASLQHEAKSILGEALKTTPKNTEAYIDLQGVMSNVLTESWDRKELKDALQRDRRLLMDLPSDSPHRSIYTLNYAKAVSHQFYERGDTKYLLQAIELGYEAIGLQSTHPFLRQHILSHLCSCYMELYESTGQMSYIQLSIDHGRDAIDTMPAGHTLRARFLQGLSNALITRYDRTWALFDLDEAIEKSWQATNAMAASKYQHLPSLSGALTRRYRRTANTDDLEKALTTIKDSLKHGSLDDWRHKWWLRQKSKVLQLQFQRTKNPATLDEAISCLREQPMPPRLIGDLAELLGQKYRLQPDFKILEEAIEFAKVAVKATPRDDPDRFDHLCTHADLRLMRDTKLRNANRDHTKELKLYREALHMKTPSIVGRVTAAKKLLSHIQFPQMKGARKDIEMAIELLTQLAPQSLRHKDKHNVLSLAAGIASDAAAATAIMSTQSDSDVIRYLEVGRNILAGSLRNLRTDISDLEKKHNELALQYKELRDQLEAPFVDVSRLDVSLDNSPLSSGKLDTDRRIKASEKLDNILEEIRRHKGLENFLLPPTDKQLRLAARDGPIVTINVSVHRCDYIIVTKSRIMSKCLPRLSIADIERYRNSIETSTEEPIEKPTIQMLKWLWETIVNPVFQALDLRPGTTSEPLPRLWWIPTGPLVGFPLHAAGDYEDGLNANALDTIVSSYSISITALAHARQQPRQSQMPKRTWKSVLIAMPFTTEQKDLPFAKEEIKCTRRYTDLMGETKILEARPKQKVLSSLEGCDIFHFAGHGHSDSSSPLQSKLLLTNHLTPEDNDLTVEELLGTNMVKVAPSLAYLSACGSGQVRHAESMDETIHLAASCQLAGFRHAIGTLWSVGDKTCVRVAELFYREIQSYGPTDDVVSRAFNTACRILRDEIFLPVDHQEGHTLEDHDRNARLRRLRPSGSLDWVPYVHFGP